MKSEMIANKFIKEADSIVIQECICVNDASRLMKCLNERTM